MIRLAQGDKVKKVRIFRAWFSDGPGVPGNFDTHLNQIVAKRSFTVTSNGLTHTHGRVATAEFWHVQLNYAVLRAAAMVPSALPVARSWVH